MPTINIGACACCGAKRIFNGLGFYLLKVVYDFVVIQDPEEGGTPVLSALTATYQPGPSPRSISGGGFTAPINHSWLGIGDQTKTGIGVEEGEDDPDNWIAFTTDLSSMRIVSKGTPALGTRYDRLNWRTCYHSFTLSEPFVLAFTDNGQQYKLSIPITAEPFDNDDYSHAIQTAYAYDEDDYVKSFTCWYAYKIDIYNEWVAKVQ